MVRYLTGLEHWLFIVLAGMAGKLTRFFLCMLSIISHKPKSHTSIVFVGRTKIYSLLVQFGKYTS